MKSASHQTFIIQANTIERRFFQKIVSIHFHLNDDSNTKDFECNLAISLGPYFHP